VTPWGVMEIRVWQGDITTLDVDAIVNAANGALARGGGVCGAIFRAAGPRLDEACAAIGSCPTGDAVATPGFDLPARWVIHAVGPVWHGGAAGEADQLASCYRRVLAEAERVGARSVAIPAISTGIYGYPAAEAARVAVDTLRAASPAAVDEVVLVAFDAEAARRYGDLLDLPQ
jgi:O-acetyl-ADP-ribose deacetylase